MSLHAQISHQAQADLLKQRRHTTITSIIIALLTLVLISITLMIITLSSDLVKNNAEPFISHVVDSEVEEKIVTEVVKNTIVSKPASLSSKVNRVVTSTVSSDLSIPVTDFQIQAPTTDFGDLEGIGDGWGDLAEDGFGKSGGFGFGIPAIMAQRCSKKDRLSRLEKKGGELEYEEAVIKSLRWFQQHQAEDGSWCKSKQVGMTGLALLCYLGHCETPMSQEFGETVENAIVYLIGMVGEDGSIASDYSDTHFPYEHAIATYALCEAYTMCNSFGYEIPDLKNAVTLSVNKILKSQNESDCWDYSFRSGTRRDASLSCWCLQALKAAHYTGIEFKNIENSAQKGLKSLRQNQAKSGAVGYTSSNGFKGKFTMSEGFVLCMQQWGQGEHSEAKAALEWVEKDLQEFDYGSANCVLYRHYYASQVMMEAGDSYWEKYNEKVYSQLYAAQTEDGSFGRIDYAVGDRTISPHYRGSEHGYGEHYRVALCTLMFEVYYRFLPGTSSKR